MNEIEQKEIIEKRAKKTKKSRRNEEMMIKGSMILSPRSSSENTNHIDDFQP